MSEDLDFHHRADALNLNKALNAALFTKYALCGACAARMKDYLGEPVYVDTTGVEQ